MALVAIFAAFVCRAGRPVLAAHLLLTALFLMAWRTARLGWLAFGTHDHFFALVYAPLVASSLLRPRGVALHASANLVGFVFLWLSPATRGAVTINVALFGVAFGVLTTYGSHLRTRSLTNAYDQRDAASRRKRELDAMFESSQDAQVFMDGDGNIVQLNARFASLFSLPATHGDGPIADVLPDHLRASFHEQVEACRARPVVWEFDLEPPGRSDKLAIEATLVSVDHGGGAPHVLMSCRDITARKRAIQQRERAVHEARTGLLNLISHHLRTPLTPMRMDLFTLRHGHQQNLSEKQAAALERLDREFKRLTAALDLLADASQLQGALNAREACDLRQAWAEAVPAANADHPAPAHLAGVHPVLADPRVLRVVLRLLIAWMGRDLPLRVSAETSEAMVHLDLKAGETSDEDQAVMMEEAFAADVDDELFADRIPLFVVANAVEASGGRLEASTGPLGHCVRLSLPRA